MLYTNYNDLEAVVSTLAHCSGSEAQLGRVLDEAGQLIIAIATASVPINFKSRNW